MADDKKEKLLKMKEIVDKHEVMNKAVKELISEGLVVTASQGRRVYYQLKVKNSI